MAYTQYSEIQSDFKDITFAAGQNVTDTDVTQFIVEADALINSYVGQKYVVPVTTGDGLNLLKLYSRCLVTARIKRLMEVKQEKSTDANQNVTSVLLSPSQVIKQLEAIRDDKASLEGATPLLTTNAFYSSNAANSIEPTILKDTKQW
jgi:phage gp36-like protein